MIVGGCARSGTTLLRTMLNSHPDLAVPHETKFMVTAWRRREAFGDLTRVDNRRDVADWCIDVPHSRFSRIGIDREVLREAFAAAAPTLGSLMAVCFELYAEKNGKPRWGDKRPSYSRNLNAVFGFFPNARFVNVVRDPRACVASMGKAWPKWGRVASATEVWERTDKAVQAGHRKLSADQILEIRYEDLVTKPYETLEPICEFLSLDAAQIPTMLDYHEGKDLPTGELYRNAAAPVNTQAVQRWMEEMSDSDIALVEHVLGDRIVHHGYELTGRRGPLSAEVMADFERVRAKRNKEERRRQLVEFKRRVTYRQPTAYR
ncbi:MAG: sulfotransferase [Streptosporangiaceae bacterium]